MPRTRQNQPPSYREHRASGQAVVTLGGKDIYLGPYGSQISKDEYDRVVAEWLANGRRLPAESGGPSDDIAVSELLAAYLQHAETYYVKDGKPTSELGLIKIAMKPLRSLYGRTLVSDFGPLSLRTIQQHLVDEGGKRTTINGFIDRMKRIFRWGVSHELVPSSIYEALRTVPGLRRGRTTAVETEPIRPVPTEYVDAVKPFVSRQIWAMVELQRLTGMRSGEVVIMRGRDLDMTGELWRYRPSCHKTAHHGHERIVDLGPRAQKVITPFLKPDLEAYLFSPLEAEAERRAEQRRQRKSKVPPSQRDRRKANPRRTPQDHYTPASYRRAIQRGCVLADKAQKKELSQPAGSERLVPRWHPHQLRHNFATEIRRKYGVEAARVLLGHHSLAITEVYAELDRAGVQKVVAQVG